PWAGGHAHGVPILQTKLTPEQQKYWESYNTTTYLTLESPYSGHIHAHLALLFISAFVLYPFVLVLNNLESNWFLPLLAVQASLSVVSCILYSVFINNVPDLYPNMAYTKMVTGWFVLTLLQALFAVVNSVRRWLNDFCSPSSTLFDDDNADTDSFNLDDDDNSASATMHGLGLNYNGNSTNNTLRSGSNSGSNSGSPLASTSQLTRSRNAVMQALSSSKALTVLSSSFGSLFTFLHSVTTWVLLAYFFVLFPTALSCLNLFGKGQRVFNLLAHFIKGGVFFTLGLLSLARYCGCFAGIGGGWNYAYIDLDRNKYGGLICTFESVESFLIFFYGCSNVFLEHLASTDGVWTAKDLQHVSIAFMYFGAGLCGLITEFKLSSWRRSLFFNVAGKQLATTENIQLDDNLTIDDQHHILGSNKMITPGFSPNPFPVFTIFWTGVLMSKHAQASALSSAIHVQWGSLLTYGSFFRVFTFFLMSYYPLHGSRECFLPSKPLTELVTSFCLLCGGMVFMESTDQVIEALAYRGLTPMFTINVSVGIISLLMAWVMFIFAVKDRMRAR
ncbi:hypothetical protein PICMEDRAFT_24177, partial [Pichia membranifaciens NRRL Y-2026]